MAVALSLTVVRQDRRPPRPCCPMAPVNGCQFRPAMIRFYLFARNDSQIEMRSSRWTGEDWIEYLEDRFTEHAEQEQLCKGSRRAPGSPAERARDVVLSLERARDELGIPLAFASVQRLADALCPFSRDALDEQARQGG